MKKLFGCFFLMLLTLPLLAQEEAWQRIYFKDGSVLAGRQIAENDKEIIWELKDGQSLSISKNNIRKIRNFGAYYQTASNGTLIPKKGYYGQVHTGIKIGSHDNFDGETEAEVKGAYIDAHFGYRFSRWIQPGISTSYYADQDYHFLQMGAFWQGEILNKFLTPFYEVGLGYGFVTNPDSNSWIQYKQKGGRFLKASLGLKFYTRGKVAYLLKGGYDFQKTEFNSETWKRKLRYNRWHIGLGIEF